MKFCRFFTHYKNSSGCVLLPAAKAQVRPPPPPKPRGLRNIGSGLSHEKSA